MQPTWIDKLSAALDLLPWEQDWGIANSDPQRIAEFVGFYHLNVVEHPWEPEALAELILASADDALVGPGLGQSERLLVLDFVREHGQEFPLTLNYWVGLPEREFPASTLVREGTITAA